MAFLIKVLLTVLLLAVTGTLSRRCQFSSNFQRYCGKHRNIFAITPEQCLQNCNKRKDCLVSHWHPGNKIWKNDARSVCFYFLNGKVTTVCPWGAGALIGGNPGARMIRCSGQENNEIERCSSSTHFQRYCGNPTAVHFDESMERCRQRCNDHAACHVAHWHPGNQIWKNDARPVCWMFPKGTKVCPWKGGELIGSHPGAQMFRCKEPRILSFEYDIDMQKVVASNPQTLGRVVAINNCRKDQLDRCRDAKKTLIVSQTTETSKSWDHTVGVSVTAGMTFSVGAPFVASAESSIEITASYDHSWGKTETQSKTWTTEDECVAGPGTTVTCEFFVYKSKLHVPFTIRWSTGQITRGVYKGVDFLSGGTKTTTTVTSKK